jgi:TolA-binding protein
MPDEVLAKQYMTEAMQCVKKGDSHKAIQIFMRLTNEIPDSDLADNAFYNLGICYKMAEEPEKAFVAFSNVVNEYPDSDAAPFAADQLEDLKDRMDEASEFFMQAEAALIKSDFDAANQGFAHILRNFKDSRLVDNALFGLGMIAKKQGDLERAKKIFDRVISDYPDSDAAQSVRDMRG